MPDLLYLLHIPKCAGTALRAAIEPAFSPEERLWGYDYRTVRISADEIRRDVTADIRLFSAHLDYSVVELLTERETTVLTLIREPQARVVAAYRHYLQHHGFEGTFAEFAERHRFEVTNVQVRRLAGDMEGLSGTTGRALLDQALANLQRPNTVFGLSEKFDDYLQRLATRLGWDPIEPPPRLNVGDRSLTPDDGEVDAHAHLWALDVELHAAASELVMR